MLKKNKKLAKIVVLFCIAALTSFAGIAQANDAGWCGEHCGGHDHHNFRKIERKLGLTDAQKAQAKAIFLKNRDVAKPIITNLRSEEKNLRALMHADTVDEAAIRAKTLQIAGIQADLNVNRAKVGAQFSAILTPTQLETLKSLHKKCPLKERATIAPAK